jgi:hypothetical protein
MKNVLVAGSRTFNDFERLSLSIANVVEKLSLPSIVIVSGGARGADSLAEQYAKENNIPFVIFKAQWDIFGKSAGIIRNEEMGRFSDLLIAFWDGESRGTKHMINFMRGLQKPVYVDLYKKILDKRYINTIQ